MHYNNFVDTYGKQTIDHRRDGRDLEVRARRGRDRRIAESIIALGGRGLSIGARPCKARICATIRGLTEIVESGRFFNLMDDHY
eukprot:scaffold27949_cov32-Prasinocladus_malaysianus.AAC.1